MKKIYLGVLLLFSVVVLNAQTLTQSFHESLIGEVDKNYRLDTSAYTNGLPSAVTGSNVVWDFTKVNGAFPVMFDSIVTPSAAIGASLFPSTSFAQKNGGINSFFKSTSNPSQTEWLGVYSPSLTITFTNSAILLKYPVTYGYSFTDVVVGTFKYNTTTGVCNGSITVIADGIGTLNLPNNVSFQNVLRVRSVEQLTMTTSLIPIGTINQSVFRYYVPGKKYALLSHQYQNYQLLIGTPTITAMAFGNFDYFTVAGIPKNQFDAKLDVYPNPFHDQLFFKNESNAILQEFSFFNLQGQLLARTNSLDNFSTSDLQPGIYLLQIKKDDEVYFRKVIKE